MSRLTKTMFGLTILSAILSVLIMAGILNASKDPRLDVVFPLTAIFYGMFLICRMMHKEVVKFDAEERKHHELAARNNYSQSAESQGHEHHEPVRA